MTGGWEGRAHSQRARWRMNNVSGTNGTLNHKALSGTGQHLQRQGYKNTVWCFEQRTNGNTMGDEMTEEMVARLWSVNVCQMTWSGLQF